MTLLLDDDQARQRVRQRLDSRQWWIIPLFGERAREFSTDVEKRFYMRGGRSTAAFEVMVGPYPVAFARKDKLPAERLAVYMADNWGADADVLRKAFKTGQDVLMTMPHRDSQEAAEVVATTLMFQQWVGGKQAFDRDS